jgi:hypothetical protein
MWDIATGRQMVCLHGHHGDIHSLALDRATILSGSASEFVRWRPVFVNYRKEAMEGHWQSRFAHAAPSRLLAKIQSRNVTVENLSDGRELASFKLSENGEHWDEGVALTTDGGLVAASNSVWDIRRGERLCELQFKPLPSSWPDHGRQAALSSMSFAPNGRFLVTGGVDGAVRLWEVPTGQELFCSPAQGSTVSAVAFSPDGRWFASVKGHQVQIWDAATGQVVRSFAELESKVNDLAYSPNGALLASANADTTVLLWDTNKAVANYQRPTMQLTAKDLRDSWVELKTAQGVVLYTAMGRLAAAPIAARSMFFKEFQRQHDRDRVDLGDLMRWLADLRKKDPDTRDRAYRELERLGDKAGPALRHALARRPDAATAFRLERLLRDCHDDKLTQDRLQLLRALSVLEWIADDDIRRGLVALGRARPPTWITLEAAAVAERLEVQRRAPW